MPVRKSENKNKPKRVLRIQSAKKLLTFSFISILVDVVVRGHNLLTLRNTKFFKLWYCQLYLYTSVLNKCKSRFCPVCAHVDFLSRYSTFIQRCSIFWLRLVSLYNLFPINLEINYHTIEILTKNYWYPFFVNGTMNQ